MHHRILRQAVVALGLTLLVVGCSKSSPTSPGGGSNGGNGNGATVTSLAITGALAVAEGATSQLTATATMSNGTTQDVSSQATWTSSNTDVATVSGTGLLTALMAGTTDINAVYSGRSARVTVTVSAARFRLTVRANSVTALGTCDGVTQGLTKGEFAVRVRVVTAAGGSVTITNTGSYPGNPNNLLVYSLGKNQSRSLSGVTSFTLNGAAGQFARVQFNATEWDSQVVLIPPSTRWIHDSSMDDRSTQRTHSYGNGSFGGLGPQTLTIGNSSCGIRLNYTVTATRQ
jgi:hypothetical protein